MLDRTQERTDTPNMSVTRNDSQRYVRATVMTASPEQLQVMLLDGAIRFALRGREALQRKDLEGAFVALERAQRIAIALGDGLNRDAAPKIVDQMRSVYSFVYRRLVDANRKRDTNAIDDAIRVLRHQRDTWSLIVEKVRAEVAPSAAPDPAHADQPGAAPAHARSRFTPEAVGPINLEG